MKITQQRFGKHVTTKVLHDKPVTAFGWTRVGNTQMITAGIRYELERVKGTYPHYIDEVMTLNVEVQFSEDEIRRLYAQLKSEKT